MPNVYHLPRAFTRGRKFALLLAPFLLLGCASESKSLHEHDHEEPDHWPTNMAEAADSIKARMEVLNSDQQLSAEDHAHTSEELLDLVEWSPEIAADTALSEDRWMEIYDLSEALRLRWQSGHVDLAAVSRDLEKLATSLRTAHTNVTPEVVPLLAVPGSDQSKLENNPPNHEN